MAHVFGPAPEVDIHYYGNEKLNVLLCSVKTEEKKMGVGRNSTLVLVPG